MNLEERAKNWDSCWTSDDEYEYLAQDEPHPTLCYINQGSRGMWSPLGLVISERSYGLKAVRRLLERGASPNEIAVQHLDWVDGQKWDAFDVAWHYNSPRAYVALLEYATPSANHVSQARSFGCWVDAKHMRTASLVCLGWLFTQMQRDDLIEPIVQRLADIPLDSWAAERPMSPSRKKLK